MLCHGLETVDSVSGRDKANIYKPLMAILDKSPFQCQEKQVAAWVRTERIALCKQTTRVAG